MAATNINKVIITGNLTRDPELRALPTGSSVCELRVACNTRRKNTSSGEWEDKPNYFNVKVWGAQGENCSRFLAKGRPVAIDGRLEWREWETPEGAKRQTIDIIADAVQFLGSHDTPSEPSEQEIPSDAEQAAPPAAVSDIAPIGPDAEEDIPF
jgi:single-strand DNA-binding protein